MRVFYWQMLSRNGFKSEVAASRDSWANRHADDLREAISENMVCEIQVVGPIDSIREQLQERSMLGADLQMLQMPQGSVADVARTLEALLH
jgi:hypothetical protein